MGDMEREEALTLKERPRPPLASPVSEQAGGGRGGGGRSSQVPSGAQQNTALGTQHSHQG